MSYPTLRHGSHGKEVISLQRKLGIRESGIYDLHTELSVVLFQKRHNMTPNGIATPKLQQMLDKELKQNSAPSITRRILLRLKKGDCDGV